MVSHNDFHRRRKTIGRAVIDISAYRYLFDFAFFMEETSDQITKSFRFDVGESGGFESVDHIFVIVVFKRIGGFRYGYFPVMRRGPAPAA